MTFKNEKTGEYQFVEYQLRSTKPKPEGVIKLQSPLRIRALHNLKINNPFDREIIITLASSIPELVAPPEYRLRPLTEVINIK